MSRAEQFRVRCQCRIYPSVYANTSRLLAPIALIGVNIPHVQSHTEGHALRNTVRTEDPLERDPLTHPSLVHGSVVTLYLNGVSHLEDLKGWTESSL